MDEKINIYEGELINCWQESDLVYLEFPWCTLNFHVNDFQDIKQELINMAEALKNVKKTPSNNWKEQIESILEVSKFGQQNDAENNDEKISLMYKYFSEEGENLMPSTKSQDFLTPILVEISVITHPLSAVVLAFKLGRIFQKYQEEFEK